MFRHLFVRRHALHALALAALCCTAAFQAEAAGERLLVGTQNSIVEFDGHTGSFVRVLVPDGSGGLSGVQNLTTSPDGKMLYVSSWSNSKILSYDAESGSFLGVFIDKGVGGLANPDQVVFGPDGNFYVSNRFRAVIGRYNGQSGAFIDSFVKDSRLGGFVAFSFGPDKNIYASEFNGTQRVLRYSGTTGQFMDVFTKGSPALNSAMSGTVFGKDGNLYASRFHADLVQRYRGSDGQFMDTFVTAGSGGLHTPDYITFGPDDHLYVAAQNSAAILRYDGHTGAFINAFATRPGLVPKGLVFVDAEVGGKVMCDGLVATIVGGNDDDVLVGTDGDDVIAGRGGNDVIYGLGGNDVICGGPGNDIIHGGDGDDRLFGGPGDDVIYGDAGNDELSGGKGQDVLIGGPGVNKRLLRDEREASSVKAPERR